MLKISVKSRKSRSKETATYYYSSGGAVKTSMYMCTAATAKDTQSGANKKELDLEVYSKGFVYK